MPRAVRYDELLMRILKDLNEVRSAIRSSIGNVPLFDIFNENSPVIIDDNQYNYSIGNYDVLRLKSSKKVLITGLRGGIRGRKLTVYNVGDYQINFINEHPTSDRENRFSFYEGRQVYLTPGQIVEFYYDEQTARWRGGFTQPPYYGAGQTLSWRTLSDIDALGGGVCWSSELLLLVAAAGENVSVSSDGETWTNISLGTDFDLRSVCWSPELELFVAVGGNDVYRVATSPDGLVWSGRTAPARNWRRVIWVTELGLFVAVSDDTNEDKVMLSSDGLTWESVNVSPGCSLSFYDVAWCGTVLIATSGDGCEQYFYSTDGRSWTARDFSGDYVPYAVCYAPELGITVMDNEATYGQPILAITDPTDPNNFVQSGLDLGFFATNVYADRIAWAHDVNTFVAMGRHVGLGPPYDDQALITTDGFNWLSVNLTTREYGDICWASELGVFFTSAGQISP